MIHYCNVTAKSIQSEQLSIKGHFLILAATAKMSHANCCLRWTCPVVMLCMRLNNNILCWNGSWHMTMNEANHMSFHNQLFKLHYVFDFRFKILIASQYRLNFQILSIRSKRFTPKRTNIILWKMSLSLRYLKYTLQRGNSILMPFLLQGKIQKSWSVFTSGAA